MKRNLLAMAVVLAFAGTAFAMDARIEVASPTFFGMRVKDMGAMSDWYAAQFGAEVVKHIDIPNGGGQVQLMRAGDLRIELLQLNSDDGGPTRSENGTTISMGHFKAGLYVHDLDEVFRKLKAGGAEVGAGGIFRDDFLGTRSFTLRDAEGNVLHILEAPAALVPLGKN